MSPSRAQGKKALTTRTPNEGALGSGVQVLPWKLTGRYKYRGMRVLKKIATLSPLVTIFILPPHLAV